MTSQMLSDETFAPTSTRAMAVSPGSAETMTLSGTLNKAFLFLGVLGVSAVAGWHYAHRIFETTSSLWFLIG